MRLPRHHRCVWFYFLGLPGIFLSEWKTQNQKSLLSFFFHRTWFFSDRLHGIASKTSWSALQHLRVMLQCEAVPLLCPQQHVQFPAARVVWAVGTWDPTAAGSQQSSALSVALMGKADAYFCPWSHLCVFWSRHPMHTATDIVMGELRSWGFVLIPWTCSPHQESWSTGDHVGNLPPWETNPASSAAHLTSLICITARPLTKKASLQRKAKPLQNVLIYKAKPMDFVASPRNKMYIKRSATYSCGIQHYFCM